MTQRTCMIDGCDGSVTARGWCRKHYNRWYKHGDPLHVTQWAPRPQNIARTIGCSVEGCERKHHAKGLCRNHHAQAWYRHNTDRAKAVQAAYRAAHPGRGAAVARAWREANPERAAANRDTYAEAHGEQLKAARRAYREANRDLIRALNNRRKARMRNVEINDLTPAQWRAIVASYRGRCAYCGRTPDVMTMDHVVAISKGGNHTASNVVPACGPCNFAKSDGPAPPFVIEPE